MALKAETDILVTMYGKTVPMSKQVRYLGVLLDDDASGSPEFRSRLAQGYGRLANLGPILKRHDLSTKLKVRVIQSLYLR